MNLSRITIDEGGLQQIVNGPLQRHMHGLADLVVNEAIQNANGRPGPRIRTGDLIENIKKQEGDDAPGADGFHIDVFSDAEHRGYPYPSRLEIGADGVLYPWLRPALEKVFQGA